MTNEAQAIVCGWHLSYYPLHWQLTNTQVKLDFLKDSRKIVYEQELQNVTQTHTPSIGGAA